MATDQSTEAHPQDTSLLASLSSEPFPSLPSASSSSSPSPAQPTTVFQGDGTDPTTTVAERPVPESTSAAITGWLMYTVSLNYNRLATSVLGPITNWKWYNPIPHTPLVLGAMPTSPKLLDELSSRHGVAAIINMCAEFRGHLDHMNQLQMVQCWIPTRDFSTPTVDSIWVGVRFLEKRVGPNKEPMEQDTDRAVTTGDKVYLHCKAGRGRSATVALCWLIYSYQLTPQEAQAILLKARPQADKNIFEHAEVQDFFKQVQEQESDKKITRRSWPGTDVQDRS